MFKYTLQVTFWLVLVLAGLFAFHACVVKAQDRSPATYSLPFRLACPDLTQCKRGEDGKWLPEWYAKELLKDQERFAKALKDVAVLTGARARLQAYSAQLGVVNKGLQERLEANVEALSEARQAYETQKTRTQRRTRWALASSCLVVLLVGAGTAYVGLSR